MNTGIFLGTFDPIHNGHIHIANEVQRELGLDRIVLIPLYDAPHKNNLITADAERRLNLIHKAIVDSPKIYVNSVELDNKITGYSMEMIHLITNHYPNDTLYYILGSDVFLNILIWKQLHELIHLFTFAVVVRESSHLKKITAIKQQLESLGATVHICQFNPLDISSTKIKKQLMAGDTIEQLVPASLIQLIKSSYYFKEH